MYSAAYICAAEYFLCGDLKKFEKISKKVLTNGYIDDILLL